MSIDQQCVDSADKFCYHEVAISLDNGEKYGRSKSIIAEQYAVYGNSIVRAYSDHGR